MKARRLQRGRTLEGKFNCACVHHPVAWGPCVERESELSTSTGVSLLPERRCEQQPHAAAAPTPPHPLVSAPLCLSTAVDHVSETSPSFPNLICLVFYRRSEKAMKTPFLRVEPWLLSSVGILRTCLVSLRSVRFSRRNDWSW